MVPSQLRGPLCYSNEWQRGPFSSEWTKHSVVWKGITRFSWGVESSLMICPPTILTYAPSSECFNLTVHATFRVGCMCAHVPRLDLGDTSFFAFVSASPPTMPYTLIKLTSPSYWWLFVLHKGGLFYCGPTNSDNLNPPLLLWLSENC